MNMYATNEARKPSRIGSLAIISGAMLGVASPAFSADLPYEYPPYRPTYYRDSYSGCYSCGPRFVAERPPVEEEIVERPVVERFPVAERHWVQRDYIERRYRPRYAYAAYPGRYRHAYNCPVPCAESYPSYESGPREEPRRHLSYAGAHFPPPATYEYESEPRVPERYAASSYRPYDYYRPAYEYNRKPAYEYEPSPRPPGPVPNGYYGPNYYK